MNALHDARGSAALRTAVGTISALTALWFEPGHAADPSSPEPVPNVSRESPPPLDARPIPLPELRAPVMTPRSETDATQQILAGWAGMHQEYTFVNCPTGCAVHDRVPDVHGGVGPASIVAITNRRITCYDKTGNTLWGPITFVNFWPTTVGFVFDPRVIYDRDSGRFFLLYLDSRTTQSFLNLAVSKSSTPASPNSTDWWFYQLEITEPYGGSFYGGDYPCVGMDSRALYVSFNMGLLPIGSGPILNCQVVVFKKTDIVAGVLTPASTSRHFTPQVGVSGSFTLQPAKVVSGAGPGNVAYFAEVPRFGYDFLRLWAIVDPIGTPQFVGPAVVPVPFNGGEPQEEGGVAFARQCEIWTREGSLTPLAPRAMDAAWAEGGIWLCHTAGGGAQPLRTIVYYYEILPNGYPSGTPTLGTSGLFDGGSTDSWGIWSYMPALGANSRGDLCLAFTRSSYGYPICPSIMAAVREAGHVRFGPAWPVKTSPGSSAIDLSRWGDYGVVTSDPNNDTFWIGHEWVPSSMTRDWSTWWANIPASSPTDALNPATTLAVELLYPNPVSRSTRLRYSVPSRQHVSLRILDVSGRQVATLVDRTMGPGTTSVAFEPGNLPSGVYFCTLSAGETTATRRLVVVR